MKSGSVTPRCNGVTSPVEIRNCISSVLELVLHMIRGQSNNWSLWGGQIPRGPGPFCASSKASKAIAPPPPPSPP